MQTITIREKEFEVFLHESQIQDRISALGQIIHTEYLGKELVLLAVMNGALIFTADLCRSIDLPLELASIRASSYRGMKSTGNVNLEDVQKLNIKGKHVIIVEDIVDTGKTLYALRKQLSEEGPASVAIASLLFKPEAFEFNYPINYVGFEIPNKFVVGYGLDFDELGRNLPDIYQVLTP